MKIKVLIAALIFALSLPAAASFKEIQKAHEVQLSDLRLPRNEVGTVAFKPCSDCDYMVKRVNGDTEWVFDGKKMTLRKFRRAMRTLTSRDNTAVTVLHHLEEDRVTRVTIHVWAEF